MPFTIADVKNFIPVDCTIEDRLLSQYLAVVKEEVDLALDNIFADPLTPVLETAKINYGTQNTTGSNFIRISAWQETGLTIKRISKDRQYEATLTESPLVLGQDYALWYGWGGDKIIGKTLPITAIQLYSKLYPNETLRVYGTFGWQAGYPNDVKQAIANIVVSLSGYATSQANNGGETGYTRIKSMTTEVEVSEEMAKDLRNQARVLTNDPAFIQITNKYRIAISNSAIII
jgi:hypothetical protein